MRWPLAFALAWALAGCASLPRPTVADVAVAQGRWPESSLHSLEAGRRAYVARCASCHTLHLPSALPAEQWPKEVAEMEHDAGLLPGERELISRFLVTMALRPAASSAAAASR